MIKSNKVYTATEYIEKIFGKRYINIWDSDIDFIHQILEEHDFTDIWDYPLNEIDHIIENDLNVVLIQCSVFNENNEMITEYRWFEVPEDFEE